MLNDLHNPASKRIAQAFLAVAFAAATLWDFRIHELRVFDGVALAALAGFFLICFESPREFFQRRREYWLLFATIGVYAVLGFALHGHRSSLAIIGLGFVGFILIGRRDWLASAYFFNWLLAAHIVFFLIQFLGFYLLNMRVEYMALIGRESHIFPPSAPDLKVMFQGATQIRAAGLFQEPNSYCLNAFVLGTICALLRPNWILIALTAATMVISQSLWGVGAGVVLLLLDAMCRARSPRQMMKNLTIYLLVTVAVFNAYLWLTKKPTDTVPYFYTRIAGIANDTSARERFLHNSCPQAELDKLARVPMATRALFWVTGGGLTTSYFEQCLPDNGIAFLLKSFGAVGSILMLSGFALALRSLPIDSKLYATIAIGFSFTTYPLVTYVTFWIWLPAILGLLRLRRSGDEQAVTA